MGTIDHVGIAVKDIERTAFFFEQVFGAELIRKNIVEDQKLISGILSLGNTKLELMQSLDKEGVIEKFIQKKGEGIHHISIRVENLDRVKEQLELRNIKVSSELTFKGSRIIFIYPKSTFGVLFEVFEKTEIGK
jgi:methylmalonyl-CoA epimerase